MDKLTRQLFTAYLSQIAKLNGVSVEELAAQFAVAPSIATRLIKKIQESTDFLKLIKMLPCKEQKGRKIGIGAVAVAGNTPDTKDRETKSPFGMTELGYACEQTDFDTHLSYAQLDAWRHDPAFQVLVQSAMLESQALALMMMGFNGIKREADTDITTYPLMQDVAVGWLQKIRNEAPLQVFDEGATGSGKITVGAGKDFENIDALFFAASRSHLGEIYKKDKRVVALCNDTITTSRTIKLVNSANKATEADAMNKLIDDNKIANRVVIEPSFFPDNTVLLTPLSNLSIYFQEGTRRRTVVDNAKRSRYENFESTNLDFIVEDYDACVLIENVEVS